MFELLLGRVRCEAVTFKFLSGNNVADQFNDCAAAGVFVRDSYRYAVNQNQVVESLVSSEHE